MLGRYDLRQKDQNMMIRDAYVGAALTDTQAVGKMKHQMGFLMLGSALFCIAYSLCTYFLF